MRSNAIRFLPLTALIVLAGSLLSPLAQAQPVYRIVGADGKVTFSDQPPPPASNIKVNTANVSATGAAASTPLPFELRQVATKYPVTLYTGANCTPCETGRALLTRRGIPFTEKTVATADDAQALQRLSGDNSLPFMTVGSQQLKGFADSEWTQFLNAAGYPPTSVLPANYRRPEPTPLVSVTAPAAAPVTRAAADAAPRPAPPPAGNAAGIRF